MIATTDSTNTIGASCSVAIGNIGNENRRNPYPPILRRIAARITEPAVGASTCASGSHVCTGHIGIFTANDAKKASHSQNCMSAGRRVVCMSAGMSVVPA